MKSMIDFIGMNNITIVDVVNDSFNQSIKYSFHISDSSGNYIKKTFVIEHSYLTDFCYDNGDDEDWYHTHFFVNFKDLIFDMEYRSKISNMIENHMSKCSRCKLASIKQICDILFAIHRYFIWFRYELCLKFYRNFH